MVAGCASSFQYFEVLRQVYQKIVLLAVSILLVCGSCFKLLRYGPALVSFSKNTLCPFQLPSCKTELLFGHTLHILKLILVSSWLRHDVMASAHHLSGQRSPHVDTKHLAALLRSSDTVAAQKVIDDAGVDVDADFVFWDYSADATAGLPACTCLHYAAMVGCLPAVAWLLELGASPLVTDALGRSPSDVASTIEIKEELARSTAAFLTRARLLGAPIPSASPATPSKKSPAGPPPRMQQPREKPSIASTSSDTKEGGLDESLVPRLSVKAVELLKEVDRAKAERRRANQGRSITDDDAAASSKALLASMEVRLTAVLCSVCSLFLSFRDPRCVFECA